MLNRNKFRGCKADIFGTSKPNKLHLTVKIELRPFSGLFSGSNTWKSHGYESGLRGGRCKTHQADLEPSFFLYIIALLKTYIKTKAVKDTLLQMPCLVFFLR